MAPSQVLSEWLAQEPSYQLVDNLDLKGLQIPRVSVFPEWKATYAAAALTVLHQITSAPYPWQSGYLNHACGLSAPYELSAPTVALSVARQSGKSKIVADKHFADALLFPNHLIVWTAHRFKVSREIFRYMAALARQPIMSRYIDPKLGIHTAGGNESLEFFNGSRIIFAARERGAIRGFAKINKLVIDEAQILSSDALADLIPTQNTADMAQLTFLGTPPRPIDNGEAFTKLRKNILDNPNASRVLYMEYSPPPGSDVDDWNRRAMGNPSLGWGTRPQAIEDMRMRMASDQDFAREACGMWDDASSLELFPEIMWHEKLLGKPLQGAPMKSQIGVGVHIARDRSRSAVAVAVTHKDRVHIEVAKVLPGVEWVMPYLKGLCGRRRVRTIVVDSVGAASSLIEPLRRAKLPVTPLTTTKALRATGMFHDMYMAATLEHIGDPLLTSALLGAGKRTVGDGFLLSSREGVDITPAVAAIWSTFGLLTTEPGEVPTERVRTSTSWQSYN